MPASDIDAAGDDLLTLCPADGACHYEYLEYEPHDSERHLRYSRSRDIAEDRICRDGGLDRSLTVVIS